MNSTSITFRQKRELYKTSINRRKYNKFKKDIENDKTNNYQIQRSFISASINRLTQDFLSSQNSINSDLFNSLDKTRGRSREAYLNNDHYRRFIKRYKTGVVGAQGFTLASKAKNEKGSIDKDAVYKIEEGWKDFCKQQNFSVCKSVSFHAFCLISQTQKRRDGEIFARKVRGFENSYRFAIQIIEPHYLDETYNEDLANGNCIRNGIEFNKWGERIAYHFSEYPKNENINNNMQKYGKKIPVSADEIIHHFNKDEFSQNRGYPDAQQTLLDIHNLKGTNSAEVIKKRVASNHMGFVIPPPGEEYNGDGKNADGTIDFEVEGGMMKTLPHGSTVAEFKPEDKGDGNSTFNKLMLKQMSVGSGLSYHSLSGDYDGLNKEALRDLTINDRDEFKLEQTVFICDVIDNIFEEWLKFALLTKKINLPFAKLENFLPHEFLPRAFDPINELEEAQANDISINNATKSRTKINRARNVDQDEIFADLSKEEKDSQAAQVPLRNQGGTASMNLLNDAPKPKPSDTPKEQKK